MKKGGKQINKDWKNHYFIIKSTFKNIEKKKPIKLRYWKQTKPEQITHKM